MHDHDVHTHKEPYMEFWAKYTTGNDEDWHPLLWHLVDTAAVTRLLWEDCLSSSYKTALASRFDLSVEEMGRLLTFWVALHDIGKAGPEFQKKNPLRRKDLENLGFPFPPSRFHIEGFHALATTLILRRILSSEEQNIPRKFRNDLALTLGGHHGEFPDDRLLINGSMEKFHVGDQKWQQCQERLFIELADLLDVPTPSVYPEGNSKTNPIFLLIAGLTTAADWVASNGDFFPFLNADLPTDEYFSIALVQAKNALTKLGWYGWKSSGESVTFEDLFPDFTPNRIQQAVIDITPELQSPFLAIVEAPTGSGKTEAALYLADTITQRDQKAGIYIAMPTQATSNQMFSRTANFLAHRYSDDKINLHLVHGAALLSEAEDRFEPTSIWGEDTPDFSNIQAHAWFLPRKKTLLAPFGVGTVDQTFLSVLKSRHFFLRLFGLSHKVLIFDEVHAYDVYMTEIFKTLLHWLRTVGTSVIILSATLPSSTRHELIDAFGGKDIPQNAIEFPRISTVSDNEVKVINTGPFPSRKILLRWIDKKPTSIVAILKENISKGGCAAVICNRVDRAQEVYEAVSKAFDGQSIEIILFHSRFPYKWRKDIEDNVLAKFGKAPTHRPRQAIVIATQVIEQSLDLDFDVMITDLAPIDLLIQRIGRLHRHEKSKTPPIRPEGLGIPTCIISAPELSQESSPPEFGSDAHIYEPYILLRTLLALQRHQSLLLPSATDGLIEDVYSLERSPDISDAFWEILQSLKAKMQKNHAESAQNASNYLIPLSNNSFLGSLNTALSDDLQSLSKKVLRAPTREISPSIQIICLTKDDEGLHILDDPHIIDLDQPLTYQQVKSCLRAAATLNNWKVMTHFFSLNTETPESFRKTAALRWHFPVVFERNSYITENFTLCLDKKRGIQVITSKN